MVIYSTANLFLVLKHCDWVVSTAIHNISGFIIDLMVILVAIGGIVAIQLQTKLNWSTKKIRQFRYYHKYAARIIQLLAISSMSSGISKYIRMSVGRDGDWKVYMIYVWLHHIIGIPIFIAFEVNF
jgi:hypothetical protein